jgi:hypothetical protein
VAKRVDSRYEPGQRSGAWQKMRVNQGQEFVIGGYTAAGRNFDAIIFGYYDDGRLVYVARTRNGFTPASRDELYKRFRGLETAKCPFANLPETRSGRWGQGVNRGEDARLQVADAAGRCVLFVVAAPVHCATRAPGQARPFAAALRRRTRRHRRV